MHIRLNQIKNRFTVLAVALFFFTAIWVTQYIVGKNSVDSLHTNTSQQLDQFIGYLEAQLNRFRDLPELISKNQQLIYFLGNSDNTLLLNDINQFLVEVNTIIGASDTYLMNNNGMTLAASNWQKERTFVGKNFNFRPYFIDALKGGLGQYFALGSTSGKRGYYFSYPVFSNDMIIGVIVVKMNLSNIEEHWAKRDSKFIVTDRYGVVLITTHAEWLYKSLYPLSDKTREMLLQSKQYGNEHIGLINYQVNNFVNETYQAVQLGDNQQNQLLMIQHDMPQTGWSVIAFSSLEEVTVAKRNALIILFLISAVVFLMVYLAKQKQKRREEKVQDQLKAQENLKHEVKVRTVDLSREIEEHKQTEHLLKETQKELIQTAKLAVLGEMSASISHELNNPLAAIRSYTDNARKFMELNKTQQVDDNLNRISGLTERMGTISSQLKLFAKKSSGALDKTNVKHVIQSAIDISSPQFKSYKIEINTDNVEPELFVKANQIQFEQVVINLLNNAMFAIGDNDNGVVKVSCKPNQSEIDIIIQDNGPGIDEKDIQKIFDPFFTTKKSGMGLGLSISARIIEGFGGKMTVKNIAPSGACFTIKLLRQNTNNE